MRRAVVIAAALLAALPPTLAVADGDPASDVLLGQNVFLPYSPVSPTVQRQLYAISDAARRAGYPIRIAVIAAKTDLGVVPALFGKPEAYARFLSSELAGVVNGPVLVVMPNGFGLSARGRQLPVTSLGGVTISPGADGLGTAAVTATERLAAAAGHALPASAASVSADIGASASTVRHSLAAMAVLTLLGAMGIATAFALRVRARRPG